MANNACTKRITPVTNCNKEESSVSFFICSSWPNLTARTNPLDRGSTKFVPCNTISMIPSSSARIELEEYGTFCAFDSALLSPTSPELPTSSPFAYNAEALLTLGIRILKEISSRSEEHTSELQSRFDNVCRLL